MTQYWYTSSWASFRCIWSTIYFSSMTSHRITFLFSGHFQLIASDHFRTEMARKFDEQKSISHNFFCLIHNSVFFNKLKNWNTLLYMHLNIFLSNFKEPCGNQLTMANWIEIFFPLSQRKGFLQAMLPLFLLLTLDYQKERKNKNKTKNILF